MNEMAYSTSSSERFKCPKKKLSWQISQSKAEKREKKKLNKTKQKKK